MSPITIVTRMIDDDLFYQMRDIVYYRYFPAISNGWINASSNIQFHIASPTHRIIFAQKDQMRLLYHTRY